MAGELDYNAEVHNIAESRTQGGVYSRTEGFLRVLRQRETTIGQLRNVIMNHHSNEASKKFFESVLSRLVEMAKKKEVVRDGYIDVIVHSDEPHLQQVTNTKSYIYVHHSAQHHPAQLLNSLKRNDVVKASFRCQLYKGGAGEEYSEDEINAEYRKECNMRFILRVIFFP